MVLVGTWRPRLREVLAEALLTVELGEAAVTRRDLVAEVFSSKAPTMTR
jgi:hypothetical protein